MAVNGKPLENTYEEWRRSPYAAQGVTCQTCHMPDRRHLWRGIHDPEMVAGGLTPHFSTDAAGARFALTSAWVGHAFPTYVTPKVILRAVALDVLGEPVRGSEVSYVIQRRVESVDGEWIEHSDTRLFPGETVSLDIGWGEVDRVRMWLEVRPDDFYDRDVYDVLLDRLGPDDPAAGLIAEADRLAVSSSFRLFETDLARPGSELDRERTH